MPEIKDNLIFADGTTQASAGLTNPMTTQDDLIVAGSGGTPDRLGKGSDGQVLTVDPTTHHLAWKTPSGLTNPMTAIGDMIIGGLFGSATRMATGSDTQVLTVNGASPGWRDPPRADTGTVAARPSAARAGRTYLPTDGYYVYRDSGSAWAPWGPLFPFTAPVDSDFSWVNQGTATIDTTYGPPHLYAPTPGSSDAFRLRVKSAPATPYTISAALLVMPSAAGNSAVGLGWRESSSGKFHGWLFYQNGSTKLVYSIIFNSPTSWNGTYASGEMRLLGVQPLWLQIAEDSTNRYCRFSHDGRYWYTYHTVSRTNFITADQVWWGVNANGADVHATLLSWAAA